MIPAVAYVRMSTDHQQYSIANQLAQIGAYATAGGFEILRVYSDEGKSGLSLSGRNGLKRLLDEITSGTADFRVVLVYDVSRWGRFQLADEAAFYEHTCVQAGIHIHYCAEVFENDASLSTILIKAIKRAMAGEYSRELSIKVFEAQRRLATQGFRQGSRAGIGFRRLAIDASGNAVRILEEGERKTHRTHRIVLVPGPIDEIELVRRIFHLFVAEKWSIYRIRKFLKVEDQTRRWSWSQIRNVLTNEKYIGTNVFNRVSIKLKGKRVENPPEQWVRRSVAFEPIVDLELFRAAQTELQLPAPLSDDELLNELRRLLAKTGALSGRIIDAEPGMPALSTFVRRFGGLQNAYGRIGYQQKSLSELWHLSPQIRCSLGEETRKAKRRRFNRLSTARSRR